MSLGLWSGAEEVAGDRGWAAYAYQFESLKILHAMLQHRKLRQVV